MRPTQMWFDEVSYFQREPTPYQQMLEVLSRATREPNRRMIGVERISYKDAQLELKRRKRKKAMENCQHGRLPFPIYWAVGTHPAGDKTPDEKDWISLGPFSTDELGVKKT